MEVQGRLRTKDRTLREEVRNALLAVLRDPQASATARAIAGRSLLQELGAVVEDKDEKPATELSIEELDAEIASIQRKGD